MKRDLSHYFDRRVTEEERRAAASADPIVKDTHTRFADFYRKQLIVRPWELPGSLPSPENNI